MRVYDIIRKKRDGYALSVSELEFIAQGCASGAIPDYQLAAWLMAVFIQGMNEQETADLTLAIANSGTRITLGLQKAVDKHSTGGVGDTTTLIVAPIVAACGVPVAKMTGRGLGHTGGTVDKLESIPGLSTALSMNQFTQQVKSLGLGLISATTEIAPADKVLYALRDVTATVDSVPLIASSIMSKKIAAGATHIVLDVKYGRGAFMPSSGEAETLAKAMVDIGRRVGRPTVALLTTMEEPLGNAIGNALEVQEAIDILSGNGGSNALRDVCIAVAAEMLLLYFNDIPLDQATSMAVEALESGKALAKFYQVISAQGGDLQRGLPQATEVVVLPAPQEGYITRIDALALGNIATQLGAGRLRKEDKIDYTAGLKLMARVSNYVTEGTPLIAIHSGKPVSAELTQSVLNTFEFAKTAPLAVPKVLKVVR